MARKTVQVIPAAGRLIRSLRDVGYDFVHAVADLVDNSIAAKAGEVAIDMRFDGQDSWLRIADNGTGMRDYIPPRLGRERVEAVIREEMGHVAMLHRQLASPVG